MDYQITKQKDDFIFNTKSKMGGDLFGDMQKEAVKQQQRFREAEDRLLINKQKENQDENQKELPDIASSTEELFKETESYRELKALTATEQLEKNFAGYMEEIDIYKEVTLPDLQEMKQSHQVETRTRVIKHTLKRNETVTEKVVKEKERSILEKKADIKLLSTAVSELADSKVKARTDMDINIKKKMDYYSFSQLSEFASYMDKEQFKTLTTLYGNGVAMDRTYDEKNPESVSKRKEAREKNLYPAMDMMTDMIMKIDPGKFDLSTDHGIARSARELEKMSGVVKSYRNLLEKNDDYFEHMCSKKVDENEYGNITYGDRILNKLERLSAISNYYELRKLVMEDDLYVSLNKEISMEEEKGDDVKTRNLKKNMRLSYYAGIRLQKVFTGATILPEKFRTKDEGADVLIEVQKDDRKVKSIETSIQDIKDLGEQDRFVERIRHEQLFIAPKEDFDLLTLAPEKQRTTPACGKYGAHLFQVSGPAGKTGFLCDTAGKTKLKERYQKRGKETRGGGWSGSPSFAGGKDEYLSRMLLSDEYARAEAAICTGYSYRRTDDEMMEMIDLLSIQKTDAWDEIKKDPEKVAYYESAYKEMAMRNYEAMYALTVRTAQTLSKAHFMHPIDLVQQANVAIKRLFLTNAIFSNVTTANNSELIEKLFAENNKDGRYVFDMNGLKTMGGGMSAINMKLIAPLCMISSLKSGTYGPGPDAYLGYDFLSAIQEEIQNHYNELEKDGKTQEIEEFKNSDKEYKVDWYISRHPEIFSAKNLMRKHESGEYLFQNVMINHFMQSLQGSETEIVNMMKSGKLDVPTDEELDRYEKSLKKRKFFALRRQNKQEVIENIQYDINVKTGLIKDCNNEINILKDKIKKASKNEEKDKLSKEIEKQESKLMEYQEILAELNATEKYITENADKLLKNDPYGIRMLRSGFAEHKYEFKGKKKSIPVRDILGYVDDDLHWNEIDS